MGSDSVSNETQRLELKKLISNLSAFIDGLERLLMEAERSSLPLVQGAVPTLGHLWLHLVGFRSVTQPDQRGRVCWNVPALCSAARSVLESFIVFYYFGIEQCSKGEAEFRSILWARQCAYKQAELLGIVEELGQIDPNRTAGDDLRLKLIDDQLQESGFYKSMAAENQKRLRKKDVFLAEPAHDIWDRALRSSSQGKTFRAMYGAIFRLLSQYSHVTPFAVQSLKDFTPNSECLHPMRIPIQCAFACTALAIDHLRLLDPSLASLVPDRYDEFMRGNGGL